ncbi:hypothetical protein [Elizabethkingia miricola]|uniref:hypothetical protein n=1 Tax=Elizabethkingia miricola TaxID=172045 RepID=UPI0038919DD6
MKKIYFIGLCFMSLASCSTNDDLQNFDKVNLNQLAVGGFRDGSGTFDEEPPSSGIFWKDAIIPKPIYGYYSSAKNRHIYSTSDSGLFLPHAEIGNYNYIYDRFLGSADGSGQEITGWFNKNNDDYVLTTNPSEFNGQNGWMWFSDIGKSYNGNEPGSFPIYRYFRKETTSHFYTRDFNELGNGKFGFVYEGIAFYLKDSEAKKARIRDGEFYRDRNTGQYYITFESTIRLIENVDVLKRVFDFREESTGIRGRKNKPIFNVDIADYIGPRGKNFTMDTKLIRDQSNGKVYLLDNGDLRHIPTPEVFQFYYFKEESIIQSNKVRGFAGKDIVRTY